MVGTEKGRKSFCFPLYPTDRYSEPVSSGFLTVSFFLPSLMPLLWHCSAEVPLGWTPHLASLDSNWCNWKAYKKNPWNSRAAVCSNGLWDVTNDWLSIRILGRLILARLCVPHSTGGKPDLEACSGVWMPHDEVSHANDELLQIFITTCFCFFLKCIWSGKKNV